MSGQEDKLLTVAQVAELAKVTHDAIYQAIRNGRLPVERYGVAVMIRESVATAWIENPNMHRRGPKKRK